LRALLEEFGEALRPLYPDFQKESRAYLAYRWFVQDEERAEKRRKVMEEEVGFYPLSPARWTPWAADPSCRTRGWCLGRARRPGRMMRRRRRRKRRRVMTTTTR
jgi:hypothetical protein